jgi:hypothetical protein
MDGIDPEEIATTAPVSITVLSVTPMRAGRLFALASVALDIDRVPIELKSLASVRRAARRV